MTLREQRCLFTQLFSELVLWINQQPGYTCALDQVKRTIAEAKQNAASGAGIANSLHLEALAGDLLIYRNGVWLTNSEDYAFAGTKWKSMHDLNRWGGDFRDSRGRPKPDGNHFSSERNGVK